MFLMALFVWNDFFPSAEPKMRTMKLCGQGERLKEATGGSKTDQEYYELVCDKQELREMTEILREREEGR